MTNYYEEKRLTTNDTTTISTIGSFVSQIVIACAVPGTTWKLQIQDRTSPNPLVWVGPITLALPPADGKPIIINFEKQLFFKDGIDVVTSGGAGTREVAVSIHFVTADQ
jgi:hypothetical protein